MLIALKKGAVLTMTDPVVSSATIQRKLSK